MAKNDALRVAVGEPGIVRRCRRDAPLSVEDDGTPNATGGGDDGNTTAGSGTAAGNAGVGNRPCEQSCTLPPAKPTPARPPSAFWWDDQLQTPCSFASNYAGAPYYCLPIADPASPAVSVEAFSDSGCITATPYLKMPSCNGAKPPKYAIGDEPTCTGSWHSIRPVIPTPAALPALWSNATGTCVPYAPDADATYYATGAVMPNTTLVQATPEP